MTYCSILYDRDGSCVENTTQPEFFSDLNLDQIVEAITEPKRDYGLKPLFWTALGDVNTVRYRQEVMRDLEVEEVRSGVQKFSEKMRSMRRCLERTDRLDDEFFKKGWILEAALIYCDAVTALGDHLADTGVPVRSRGLMAFRGYLHSYIRSEQFQTFVMEAQQVKRALAEVTYCVIIEPGKFKVKRAEGEADYSPEVEKTFERFKQREVPAQAIRVEETEGMSHIEAKILEFVSRLYPEPFDALNRFCTKHYPFLDERIAAFDREIQFYIAYLDFIADLKHQDLPFCYPDVTAGSKEIEGRDVFDLALAYARRQGGRPIVLNDFFLKEPERILVITGPNQGGKTTFARMFGQLHYLASLGCPVPGRKARLFLFDHIFTHFERSEDAHNLRGKLEDDLIRIHDMIDRATADSIFIVNEIFTSTTVQDALFLSKEIVTRLMRLDALAVWVTFLDELASLGEKTVSMVAMVDPKDPTQRTFKVVRKPAEGLAYALALARRHGLTYEQIMERLS